MMFVLHALNGKLCNLFFSIFIQWYTIIRFIFGVLFFNIISILCTKTAVSRIVVLDHFSLPYSSYCLDNNNNGYFHYYY